MRAGWLICASLTACNWAAAVDTYCLETGHCGDGGGAQAAGGGTGTGGAGAAGGSGGSAGSGVGGSGGSAGSGGGGGSAAPNGTPCTAGTGCASGRCVDGRCCDGICNNACDFCDLPGLEGRCEVAPLGHEPSTPCSGYFACNGVNTGCPSTCASDAGCSNARCASGGACIPKISRLKDDFDAGIDLSLWTNVSPTCTVVNGALHATTVPNTTSYVGVFSRYRYDLTDSEVRLELVDPGNQSQQNMEAIASACNANGSRCLHLFANRNDLVLELENNGNFTYPWGVHGLLGKRYLRVRESGGTLFFEAGATPGSYSVLGQTSTPLRQEWTDVTFDVGAGTFMPQGTATTVIWDNLNMP